MRGHRSSLKVVLSEQDRRELGIADFTDKAALAERLHAFIAEWNQVAHPFRWTAQSFDKVLAKCQLPTPTYPPAQIAV